MYVFDWSKKSIQVWNDPRVEYPFNIPWTKTKQNLLHNKLRTDLLLLLSSMTNISLRKRINMWLKEICTRYLLEYLFRNNLVDYLHMKCEQKGSHLTILIYCTNSHIEWMTSMFYEYEKLNFIYEASSSYFNLQIAMNLNERIKWRQPGMHDYTHIQRCNKVLF